MCIRKFWHMAIPSMYVPFILSLKSQWPYPIVPRTFLAVIILQNHILAHKIFTCSEMCFCHLSSVVRMLLRRCSAKTVIWQAHMSSCCWFLNDNIATALGTFSPATEWEIKNDNWKVEHGNPLHGFACALPGGRLRSWESVVKDYIIGFTQVAVQSKVFNPKTNIFCSV